MAGENSIFLIFLVMSTGLGISMRIGVPAGRENGYGDGEPAQLTGRTCSTFPRPGREATGPNPGRV
jgi:hypothetical protein